MANFQIGSVPKIKRSVWGKGRKYKIESEIGMGGEAIAMKGRDAESGAVVFLKDLTNHVPLDPKAKRDHFEKQQREVFDAFGAAAGSTFVCRPLDFVETLVPNRYLQVFEWHEGQDLKVALDKGSLSRERKRFLANMIADGLAAMHERGFALIDMKPDNVFVKRIKNQKGEEIDIASIIDITSAWKPGYKPKGVARGHYPVALCYTEGWVSPEIVLASRALESGKATGPEDLGDRFPGTASDVFITGLIFYQLLAERFPFPCPQPRDQARLVYRICKEYASIPNPASTASLLSKDQGKKLLEMLHPIADKRPTMRDVHQTLLGGGGVAPTKAPGNLAVEFGRKTVVLKKPNEALALNPQGLEKLGAKGLKVNVGRIAYFEKRGWALSLTRHAAGVKVKLDNAAVNNPDVLYSLEVGNHTLSLDDLKIDLEVRT